LKSVSAIAEKVEVADVLAKVLFVSGQKKGMALAKEKKIAAAFLDYRGNVFVSDEMRKYFA
jgi:thiamine biosynthesis lipoprotein ApbE